MDIERVVNFWVTESEYDLKVAWDNFNAKNYSYALFFAHLALEKTLKAIYVNRKKEHAPFIHNLIRLAEISDVDLNQEQLDELAEITVFNRQSRYPDESGNFRKKCNEDFTRNWLNKVEELHKWLKSMI